MDRRKALRNIGTGIGAIAVTPTVISLFQSCQTAANYSPVFIPMEDFNIISNLMELIIPKTEIPGAIELKLPEFADAYIDAVWSKKQKGSFAEAWGEFLGASTKAAAKETPSQLSIAEWDAQLAKYLKPGNEIPSGEEGAAKFAQELRSLTVNAFKTNEFYWRERDGFTPQFQVNKRDVLILWKPLVVKLGLCSILLPLTKIISYQE